MSGDHNMHTFTMSDMVTVTMRRDQWEAVNKSIDVACQPMKTLTDVEIKCVLAQEECWIGDDFSMPNYIAFAKAILREAQKK